MANLPDPVDDVLIDLSAYLRSGDRARLTRAIRDLTAWRDRHRLARRIEHGCDLDSRYTQEAAARCGLRLVRLEDEGNITHLARRHGPRDAA